MARISVVRTSEATFRVEVKEGSTKTMHDVTATPADVERYGGDVEAERLVRASFEFLLEREPKESILGTFALPVIERYFSEYPSEIKKYLP